MPFNPETNSSPPPPKVDMATLLAQVEGDTETLHMLAEVFLQEGPSQLEAVTQATDAADAAGLAASAHKIKGSVGVFGAEQAVAAALALERAGHSGDLSTVQEPYRTLCAEIRHLINLLESVVKTS